VPLVRRSLVKALSLAIFSTYVCMIAPKADTVWFRSAPTPLSPLAARLAAQPGAAAPANQGDRISGELYRPAGPTPYKAVVALLGCTGRFDLVSEREITRRYTDRGYVVLWVDSFSARGIAQ
jgi:hypothetical protein